ncbi:hypothetical protein MB27_07470 [Actinoplanes utahensis]|uniref:Uncharacterized protein n=1 Tax=Actinoplanes utahensis TaxID=1869 RepID=A0A0A6UP91_ACTUT|nr:hypothetical protein MB27_07470 [Actinoplanes utahensis]
MDRRTGLPTWSSWCLHRPRGSYIAGAIGLMAELPLGRIGDATMAVMGLYSRVGSPIPALVFGVA